MEAQRWNLTAVMKLNIAELGLDPRSVGFHLPRLPSCPPLSTNPHTQMKVEALVGWFPEVSKEIVMELLVTAAGGLRAYQWLPAFLNSQNSYNVQVIFKVKT